MKGDESLVADKKLFIDDNETSEDIRLDLPDEEIDSLYDKIFGENIK